MLQLRDLQHKTEEENSPTHAHNWLSYLWPNLVHLLCHCSLMAPPTLGQFLVQQFLSTAGGVENKNESVYHQLQLCFNYAGLINSHFVK